MIEFTGTQCENISEAVDYATVIGEAVQLRDGRYFAVTDDAYDILIRANAIAATYHHHEQSRQILSVPID